MGIVSKLLSLVGLGSGADEDFTASDIFDALRKGDVPRATAILEKSAGLSGVRDERGRTPLRHAAYQGHAAMAELLLGHGADVNARDDNGQTPLHNAAYKGHAHVVELLLAKGADVNAKDNNGASPLHNAVSWGQNDVVAVLRKHGAEE